MKIKSKTVSTSFSILPNDFKKIQAAFLKRVSFQIVLLQVVINCRTSEISLIKARKSSLGFFKQETNISAMTIAPALINGFLGIPFSCSS
jgi:hypothetical protein